MSERLPDRLLRDGARSLSDDELVAVLLHSSCRGTSARRLAGELLEGLGGLGALATVDEGVIDRKGIGPVRAAVLIAAREMAARMCRAELAERPVLDSPELIARYVSMRYFRADQEVMGALFLDVKNRLIADREVFLGSLSRIQVEARVILRAGLRHRAAGVVLFHTHPSGNPTPSADDKAFTHRLTRAGDLIGIRVLDHIVVGGMGRWVSMSRVDEL